MHFIFYSKETSNKNKTLLEGEKYHENTQYTHQSNKHSIRENDDAFFFLSNTTEKRRKSESGKITLKSIYENQSSDNFSSERYPTTPAKTLSSKSLLPNIENIENIKVLKAVKINRNKNKESTVSIIFLKFLNLMRYLNNSIYFNKKVEYYNYFADIFIFKFIDL